MSPLQQAQQLLESWSDELKAELPNGVRIFDAHVHLGDDIARRTTARWSTLARAAVA